MSEWDDRFETHESLQLVRQARDSLEAADTPDDPAVLEHLQRARKVLAAIIELVEGTDAELVPKGALDRLIPPARNVAAGAQSFSASLDAAQLTRLNTHLHQLVEALAAWPPSAVPSGELLREAATTYRRSVGQLLNAMQSDVDTFSASVRSAEQELAELRDRRAEEESQTRERIAELAQAIDAQKTRLDTILNEHQRQFSEAEAGRLKAANDAAEELRKSVAASLEDARSEGDSAIEDLRAQSKQFLDELAEKRRRRKSF